MQKRSSLVKSPSQSPTVLLHLDEEDLDLSRHSWARVGVDDHVGHRVHGDVVPVGCDDLKNTKLFLPWVDYKASKTKSNFKKGSIKSQGFGRHEKF